MAQVILAVVDCSATTRTEGNTKSGMQFADLEQRANNALKSKLTSTLEGLSLAVCYRLSWRMPSSTFTIVTAGKMLLALVQEFLAWTNMTYTLKVMRQFTSKDILFADGHLICPLHLGCW